MPFEQAKHQFETITQGTPEKVEGNWQQFRHEIGNYLMNKQQEVTEYIEKSDYPGKDKDLNDYHGELRDSIGGIINDNEVTRTEMTEYKNLLTTRSEALKQKIETVAVEKEFKAIESIYKFAGLNLNIQDNIRVYLSVPKNQRIPVQQIKEYLDKFSPFPMVGRDRIYRPKEATDFIKENSNVLYTMLNHLCYGSKERAEALAKPIIEQLQFIDMCAETANARENQDVFKNVIGTSEMIFILSSLIDTGISKDKVAGFFLTNFKKLRDIAGDDFEKTFSAYRLKPDLNNPQVWLAGILAVSEARNPRALDAIRLTMKIEGEILSKKADILNIIHHKNLLRNDLIRKVYAYNEIEPEVSIDKNISRFERESAQTGLEIAVGEKELVLLEAKHALANMYLGESGVNPSSSQTQGKIREILNAGSSNDIHRLSLELNLRRSPRQLAILQAKELEEGVARQEYEYKQFIENNGRINENENVIGTLDRFYRTGSLSGSSKEFLREGYGIQSEHLKKLIDEHEEKASDNQPYFDEQISLNYKTIRDVPRANVAEVIQRLSGQMALLKNLHASHIRYIGFLESQLVLGESAARINKQVNDSKSKLTGLAEKINQIRRFLGVEEEDKELADVENQILSPIAMPIMRREFASYFNKIDQYQKNVAEAARPIDYIGKNIERWQEENPRLVPDQFDRGIASIDKLVATLESARGNLGNDIKSLEGELADTEKENALPESFRATRKQFIRKLIDDIKILLNSPDSGFSRMNIMNVSLMAMQLRNDRYKYLRHGMFKGIATAFILVAAVGVACLGAFAVQGVVANIAVSGTLSAKLGAGTLTTGMISAGGVLGARSAQLIMQAADMADFGGGLKIINPKDMAKDFAFGFAICGGAILSAKALVGTLRWAAKSEGYVSFRWPGMTRFAQNSLNRLDRISDFANPITWWRGRTVPGTVSASAARQGFFRNFGRETREEIYQESLEEAAGRIHPTGEFLIAMASSARAGGRRLGVHGLRAAQVGISVEGNSMVYTTRTPQEFLANFRQQNPGTEGTDYRMKVDNDNSVTIELMSGRVDPQTGVNRIYSVIDVKPAMDILNISTDVEFARVRGLTTVEGRPDVFRVQNTEQGIDVLAGFYNRGFNIIKTETGTIRVSKGERSIEIEGTAEMMQQLNIKTAAELTEQLKNRSVMQYLRENAAKIKEYFSRPRIKRAFEEFITKWKGNYEQFMTNNPRLARIMPVDLKQLAVISGAAITAVTGVPLMLGLSQESSLETALREPVDSLTPEHRQVQNLALRLREIGMNDIAENIANPEANFVGIEMFRIQPQDISTMQKREQLVAYLEQAHAKITEIAREIEAHGFTQEANELLDYTSKDKYRHIEDRTEAAEKFSTALDKFYSYQLNFNRKFGKAILEKLDLNTEAGQKIRSLLLEYRNAVDSNNPELISEVYNKIDQEFSENGTSYFGRGRRTELPKLIQQELSRLPENPEVELRKYQELATETELRDQSEYGASLRNALNALRDQNGIVQLRQDVPTIVVQDLHGRREALVNILSQRGPDGRTNLEKLQNGEIQMIIMGDAMHREGAAADRWRGAEQDFRSGRLGNSNHMNQEMVDSLNTMKIIMDLKSRYPQAFHYLKGNHDNISNRDEGGDHMFGKYSRFVGEGELVKEWIIQRYGNEFLANWAQLEQSLPILAIGNNFVASHSEPGNTLPRGQEYQINSLEELVNRDAATVEAFTWSRTEEGGNQANRVLELAGLNPLTAYYVVGHTHVKEEGATHKIVDNRVVRINNPNEVHYAIIPADGQFNPDLHIYNAEKAGELQVKEEPTLTSQHRENLQRVFRSYEYHLPRGNQLEINDPQGIVEIKIGRGVLNIAPHPQYGYVLINLARPNQPIPMREGSNIPIGNPPNDLVFSRAGNIISIKNNFTDADLRYEAL